MRGGGWGTLLNLHGPRPQSEVRLRAIAGRVRKPSESRFAEDSAAGKGRGRAGVEGAVLEVKKETQIPVPRGANLLSTIHFRRSL
jgi:hypothetical protein